MEKNKLIVFLKIVSIVLLLACLMDMPYGFYQLVRFVETGIFGYIGYDAINSNRKVEGYIFIGLAVLFQPFVKIALGREVWNFVDVIIAVGLTIQILRSGDWKLLKEN